MSFVTNQYTKGPTASAAAPPTIAPAAAALTPNALITGTITEAPAVVVDSPAAAPPKAAPVAPAATAGAVYCSEVVCLFSDKVLLESYFINKSDF